MLFLAVLNLAGCTAVSGNSRRVALIPTPGAPPQLRGSPGIGLAARIPVGPPHGGQGDGVAVASFQPEVNGVFKFAEHAYGSFDLNITPGAGVRPARRDLPKSEADLSFGALIGFGYDFQLYRGFGMNVSAEGGFNMVTVTTSIGGRSVGGSPIWLYAGRIAVAPYLEIKDVRLFAGAVVSSDVWSQPAGFASATCVGCGIVDSGRTETAAMLMGGVGARYQPDPMFAVSLEIWAPIGLRAAAHAPQVALAVQVGNFDFSRSKRPPEPPPPVELQPPPPPRRPLPKDLTPVPVPL